MSPNHVVDCFYSYRFLRWWAVCTRTVTFPASRECDKIVCRKSTMSPFLLYSFHLPFMFLSCSFHVDLILYSSPFMFFSFCIIVLQCFFHLAFSPFMFRLPGHQTYGSTSQVIRSIQSGRSSPKRSRRFQNLSSYRVCYQVDIMLEACAGCHLQGS